MAITSTARWPPLPATVYVALLASFLVCLSIAGSVGCGSRGGAGDAALDDSRIGPLTKLYATYMNMHSGSPPASEQEFKSFITERGTPLLQSAGVSSVDDLFVSPRDNKPHVILYGKEAAEQIGRGVLTYERNGVGGRRLVGFRIGFVEELDEAEFRKLVPAS